MNGEHTVHPTPPPTPHLAHGAHLPPSPWISRKRGMFGCSPLSHKVLPFPAAPNFPTTPAPPETAASPPKAHTPTHTQTDRHTHTLLRIPGSGEPLAPHPWPGVLHSFPAPSPALPTGTESSASCPSPHFTHLFRTLASSSQNSAPSLPPGSAQQPRAGWGVTAGSLSSPDQIRVASAVLLLGKVVVVVGG